MTNTDLVISNYFSWKTFSTLEVLRYKFQTFLLEILCKYIDCHCWSIEYSNWELSEIKTIESFKKHNVRMLKCDFCMIKKTYTEVEDSLTASEISIYNHQVKKSFKNHQLEYLSKEV
jgi:hypothetical protein